MVNMIIFFPQTYLWSDKYRPRKPRFFNRVHTVGVKCNWFFLTYANHYWHVFIKVISNTLFLHEFFKYISSLVMWLPNSQNIELWVLYSNCEQQPGQCVVFLYKTHHSDSQCLNPPWNRNEYGYHWTVSKAWWNAGVLSAMDWHPILGEWQLIQCIDS